MELVLFMSQFFFSFFGVICDRNLVPPVFDTGGTTGTT